MPHLPFHPAPGLGDLLAGSFVVPQNPVHSDGTLLVPSVQATAPGRVVKVPHLADLVAASFVVPQNPLITNMPTRQGLHGCSGIGCGCAGVGCGEDWTQDYYSLNGLGGGMGALSITAPGGYFSSGMDYSQWGIAEWGSILAGAWVLYSTVFTTKQAVSAGRARGRRVMAALQNPRNGRVIAGYGSTTMNGRVIAGYGSTTMNTRRKNGKVIAGYGSTTMNPSKILTGYGSTVMNGAGRTNVVFNGRQSR